MSTIKANKLEHISTSNGGIQLDNAGHVTIDGQQLPTAGALSNRNLVINGAMQISQRGDDFQPPADGEYTLDRFQAYQSSADAYDVQRVTDTPSNQGFKNSLKVTSNAATSIAAGGYYYLGQRIEGNNWVKMGYGASGAKTCTVSFWVKSSLTGTFSGVLKNSAQNRSLVFEYTISSADTWEYKQVTIAGDTSGTWLTGSGTGAWVYFSIGVGTTFATGTANTWQATNLVGTTGSVDLVETSGATWFMTGLQVEEGEKATPFEFRSYGDELARCQRYYQRASASSGSAYARCIPLGHMATNNILRVVVPLHPPMRAQPSFNFSGSFATQPNVGTPGLSLETSNSAGGESVTLVDSSSISGTVGNCISIAASNDDDAYMEFSAEL